MRQIADKIDADETFISCSSVWSKPSVPYHCRYFSLEYTLEKTFC